MENKSSKFFCFTAVVWGNDYINYFLKWVIPSLLAPNNIPYLSLKENCKFIFYTTREYLSLFKNSDPIKDLKRYVEIDFQLIEGINKVGKYQTLAQSHQHFIRFLTQKNEILIFIHSDVIYANGCIKKLYELEKKGIRAVVNWEPRVNKEKVEKEIDKFQNKSSINISNRKLVEIALKNLHSENEAMTWQNEGVRVESPHCLLFKNKNGILVKPFILNPVLINPKNRSFQSQYNLDADYLLKTFEIEEIFCITDTDDFCTIDFTSEKHRANYILDDKQTVNQIADWVSKNTNSVHQHYFTKTIFFHSKNINKDWDNSKNVSKRICEEIFSELKKKKNIYSPPTKIQFRNILKQKIKYILIQILKFNYKYIFEIIFKLYRNFFKGKLNFTQLIKY